MAEISELFKTHTYKAYILVGSSTDMKRLVAEKKQKTEKFVQSFRLYRHLDSLSNILLIELIKITNTI